MHSQIHVKKLFLLAHAFLEEPLQLDLPFLDASPLCSKHEVGHDQIRTLVLNIHNQALRYGDQLSSPVQLLAFFQVA